LLKLGIVISERTVSRYLHGRPTSGSQTWRTFFANHFGGQIFMSPVMFAGAHGEDLVVDAPDRSVRPAASIAAACRSIHSTSFDVGRSRQPSSLGVCLGLNCVPDQTGARTSRGLDPPCHLWLRRTLRHSAGFLSCAPIGLCDYGSHRER
jgi:hypothetical protein